MAEAPRNDPAGIDRFVIVNGDPGLEIVEIEATGLEDNGTPHVLIPHQAINVSHLTVRLMPSADPGLPIRWIQAKLWFQPTGVANPQLCNYEIDLRQPYPNLHICYAILGFHQSLDPNPEPFGVAVLDRPYPARHIARMTRTP